MLQAAWKSYADGKFTEALNGSIVAAQQANNPRYALHLACRCLLEDGRYNDLLAFLEKIHGAGTHAANVLVGALNAYLLDGRYDLLHDIYRSLPETHMAGMLALYHSACAHIGQGDLSAGLEKAVLFRDRCRAFWQLIPFVEDDALNVIYRQTASLRTRAEVDDVARAEPNAVPAIHSLEWQSEIPTSVDEPVVHFACADTGYLRGFASHLLGSLNETGVPVRLHLNIMRPDESIVDELQTIASTLTNVVLDVSTSQTRNTEPSLYASGRFFVLPELLKQYRVPIVTVDADSHVTPAVRHLAALPPSFDIGFFQTQAVTPSSMFDCAAFVTNPTPGAERFLETFLACIDPLLDGRQRLTWLVDQATIFTLWVYYNVERPEAESQDVRMVDLRQFCGGVDLYEIVPNAVPEEEKDSIKISNSVSAFFEREGGERE